jgi:uncharacterized protein GlcG (DUF336 family)
MENVFLEKAQQVVEELVNEGRAKFSQYPPTEGQDEIKVGVTVMFGGLSLYVNGIGIEGAKAELARVIARRAQEQVEKEQDWNRIVR